MRPMKREDLKIPSGLNEDELPRLGHKGKLARNWRNWKKEKTFGVRTTDDLIRADMTGSLGAFSRPLLPERIVKKCSQRN